MAVNAFKLGATEYFHKPDADTNSLRRAIRYAIERGAAQRELRENEGRLRSLSHRLVEVQEAERRSIARELHDEVGQMLTALQVKLEMASRHDRNGRTLEQAQKLLRDLMSRVRDLSLDLRPAILDDLGLLPALIWHFERYTAQTGIRVDFKHSGLDQRLTHPDVETAAFRIVQEALTNTARHAGVDRVVVRFDRIPDAIQLEISDKGDGFDVDSATGKGASLGLSGMQERATLLGGRIGIASSPGDGTRITANLPLNDPS
jgi:signal transduction histidine kinase